MIKLPAQTWYQSNTFWQIGLAAAGGTFFDWTINYLLDNRTHVVVNEFAHQDCVLSDNPCRTHGDIAHDHFKNHPKNMGEILWQSTLLHSVAPCDMHTFYCYNHTNSVHDRIYLEHNLQLTKNFFQQTPVSPQVIIYGDFVTADLFLLYRYLRSRHRLRDIDSVIESEQLLIDKMQSISEIYLKREILALEFTHRRQKHQNLLDLQSELVKQLTNSAMPIGISSVFLDLDKILPEIFARFKNLPWKIDKVSRWLDIYQQWQHNNSSITWFLDMPDWVDAVKHQKKICLPIMDQIAQCCFEAELMKNQLSIKNHGLQELPGWTDEIEVENFIHNR